MLRSAEMLQGYPEALLTHKKGPVEILLPAGIYVMAQRLNEAAARLPFALLNLAGLFAVFLLGWRLYHPVAGWAAAMLLALDGYFIGFARIVQYQSVVFLMVVLTVLVLYRLVRAPHNLARYLTLAAIFLATGLLAHYEAALVALPAAYLLYTLWRRHPAISLARLGRSLLAPLLVGGATLAMFYVPFVLNPSFRTTYAYITVNRIGSTFPYNNLVDVFERTTLYSTVYYVGLLVLCALISLAAIYRRNLPRALGWGVSAALAAGVLVSLWRPGWIMLGGNDHTWIFFAAALLIAWALPNFPLEQRVAWLWFGGGLIFMLFFTLTPNTHVYGFFIPWALVAGEVLGRAWQVLHAARGPAHGAMDRRARGRAADPALRQLRLLVFRRHGRGGAAHLAREPPARLSRVVRHAHTHVDFRLPAQERLEGGRRARLPTAYSTRPSTCTARSRWRTGIRAAWVTARAITST